MDTSISFKSLLKTSSKVPTAARKIRNYLRDKGYHVSTYLYNLSNYNEEIDSSQFGITALSNIIGDMKYIVSLYIRTNKAYLTVETDYIGGPLVTIVDRSCLVNDSMDHLLTYIP